MEIQLRQDALLRHQAARNWSATELARRANIDRTYLWRMLLRPTDPRHRKPGKRAIEGLLRAFPELQFNDLFFLADPLIQINKREDVAQRGASL